MAFEYKLKKTGRRISDIEFLVNRQAAATTTSSAATSTVVVPTDEATLRLRERLVKDFKLREDQAHTILKKFPQQEINRTLYDISLKKKDIINIGAYTAKTFGI